MSLRKRKVSTSSQMKERSEEEQTDPLLLPLLPAADQVEATDWLAVLIDENDHKGDVT